MHLDNERGGIAQHFGQTEDRCRGAVAKRDGDDLEASPCRSKEIPPLRRTLIMPDV